MIHQGGHLVLHMKLLGPFPIIAVSTKGLLCARTVPIAFCMNYIIWLWS